GSTATHAPGIKFISASSGFVVSLSLRSFRATQKAFTVEQNPGDSMFCCFRLARIVSTDAVIQILIRTYVASSVLLTLQNVTIKHSSAVVAHIGARGFEPPTSWSQTTRSTKLSYAPNRGKS